MNSVVSVVTRLWTGRSRFLIPVRARDFSPEHLDPLQGPPSFLFDGYGGLFPWDKAAGR